MKVKLGDIFEIGSGGTPSKSHPEYYGGDIPWVKTGDLKSEYLYEVEDFITKEGLKNSSAKLYEPDTVLIAMYGATIGATSILKMDACTNQACAAFKKNDKVIPEYLYYFLKSQKVKFVKDGVGGAQPNISAGYLKKVEMELPSLDEQRAIVEVLDKTTNIMVMRNQEIASLDNLIKARFVEMFGDLNINDKGWREISLFDACNKLKRYPTFCNMEYLAQGVRVIRISNILMDGHMDVDDENYVFVYDGANIDFPDTVIELQDIVMAVRGDGSAAKRIGIIQEEKLVGANISPNLIRIQAKREIIEPVWLFYYLTSEVGQKRLDAYVNKTAKKNIAAKDIAKIVTPVPDLNKQKQYVDFANQVDKSKVVVQKALDEAQLLFDSLMQKYFG